MAMGRRSQGQQQEMFLVASEIRSSANPFYRALDRLLEKHGFDTFAEDTCRAFYAENRGRPGIPPGVYFRMMMVGYLEGIGSERGIAWRCADSISLREWGTGCRRTRPSIRRCRRRASV